MLWTRTRFISNTDFFEIVNCENDLRCDARILYSYLVSCCLISDFFCKVEAILGKV